MSVGETSVIIAVSSAHRRDALEVLLLLLLLKPCSLHLQTRCKASLLQACHWLIDELKAEVPIWKKEFFSDGSVWKSNASGPAQCMANSQS